MAQSSSETNIDTGEATNIRKEETNYLRIANLLLRVTTPVVRQKFDREFNPGGLQTVLNQKRSGVLTSLSKKHVVNKKQWELLFPQKGSASSITFDLTLMLVLIRHLTPIQIGDILPVSSLIDEAADLSRLKYYRNELTHNEDGTLTDIEFERWWNDISQALIRLGGQQYQLKCLELKERRLDDSDREILTELRNIDKTNDPIPVGVKHIHYKKVKDWEESKNAVYETRAIDCLSKMVKEKDIITVIGSPGCGKTTAIHYVALLLNSEEGYDIIPSYKPSEIKQYYDPKRKQVFVFDDVCGKFSLHLETLRDWLSFSDDIQKIFDEKLTKILISCRSYIFHQLRNAKILLSAVCDLQSPNNELNVNERYEIAKSHLTEDEANTLQKIPEFTKYDFFPLLCAFYAKNRTCDMCKFFTSPVDVIKEDLMAFMNEADQTTFATLALFVIYNNNITEDMLSRNSKLKATLDELLQECKMTNYFSVKVVKEQLDNLTKSYAKKTVNGYCIIHDKLFDILVSFYGEHMFNLILDLCHKDVFRDRYHFESVKNEHYECFILVSLGQEEKYFAKLCEHLDDGHIDVVFENRMMKYDEYRMQVIKLLKENEKLAQRCTSFAHVKKSPIFTIASQGHSDILKVLLEIQFEVNLRDEDQCTPLYVTSSYGHTNCVELLLHHKGDPNICGKEEQSPLYVASKKGYTDIVKLLLSNNCNPNQCDKYQQSPLHVAAEKGHTDIVQLLLKSNGDPNKCDYLETSPLYVASKRGHLEIVRVLLNNQSDPNKCNSQNASPLYKAAKNGHSDIVQLLLNCSANSNIYREDKEHIGETPLYIASCKGHTEIVQLLLKYNADPNIYRRVKDYKTESPLFIASRNGHNKIVQLLLKSGAKCFTTEIPLYFAVKAGNTQIIKLLLEHNVFDLDRCDMFNQSPLFIACWNGNETIVELLLEYKCNPDICNKNKLSPLFIASRKGFTKIVKVLLKHGASVELCDRYQQSPLFIASKNRHLETIKVLLEYRSNPLLCNQNGLSPLTMSICNAYKGANKDIFTLLLTQCIKMQYIEENAYFSLVAVLNGESEKLENIFNQQHVESNVLIGGYISPLFIAACLNNATIVKMLLGKWNKHQSYDRIMQSSFLAACLYGFVDIVRLLLEFGHDPNQFSETTVSPLCVATQYGHLNVVKLLIEQGCDPNTTDSEKKSPLFISALCDYPDIAQYLLEQNSNVDFRFTDNSTCLYISSLLNHVNIVKLLLAYKCKTDLTNMNNETPLFVASQMNHLEIVRLLLENGCDLNLGNKYQQSPLHAAVQFVHKDIVRMLLENKCDPNLCNKIDGTPICTLIQKYVLYRNYNLGELLWHHSPYSLLWYRFEQLNVDLTGNRISRKDLLEVLQLLLKYNSDPNLCNKDKESPLRFTILNYTDFGYDIIEIFLKHNANPKLCNTYGQSPLHAAATNGLTYVVKLLLEEKVDPNLCDSDNISPLYLATAEGNIDVLQILLQHNANPYFCDTDKRSPLHVASIGGHTKIVKLLLTHKCNPNLCDVNDETPLFEASRHGHLEIVKLLLEHNCSPTQCNIKAETPLFIASKHGHLEIVKFLLEHNCSPIQCNDNDETPLFIASKHGHLEIVKYLLKQNCIFFQCNNKGETPLFIASKHGHLDIVKILLEHNCTPYQCNNEFVLPWDIAMQWGNTNIADLLLQYSL